MAPRRNGREDRAFAQGRARSALDARMGEELSTSLRDFISMGRTQGARAALRPRRPASTPVTPLTSELAMRDLIFVRRVVLASAVALSLTSLSAGVESAAALTITAPVAQVSDGETLRAIQIAYGHRSHRSAHAGLYGCGRGSQGTHLSRMACGGRFSRQMMRHHR